MRVYIYEHFYACLIVGLYFMRFYIAQPISMQLSFRVRRVFPWYLFFSMSIPRVSHNRKCSCIIYIRNYLSPQYVVTGTSTWSQNNYFWISKTSVKNEARDIIQLSQNTNGNISVHT